MTHRDVAIIGMACLFPKAPNLAAYWQNIVSKVDATSEPPWAASVADGFYDPDPTAHNWLDGNRGGFLGPLASFDPLEHNIMPSAVQGGEPDQWLALKVARDALADAGYGDEIPERHRTAVILGKGNYLNFGNLSVVQHARIIPQTLKILKTLHPEYTDGDLQLIKEALEKSLPPFHTDTVPGLIPNITASRIANRLDLMGPSHTVDAACASSLIAAHIAVHDLLTHQCDLALVGGVHVVTPDPLLLVFSQVGALSRQHQIRPFDKDADGTMLGEGVGMVVLKRVEDAARDGDRIYAVIRGIGISSDGRGLGVMAPRLEGEILALQRAYEQAGISPRSIGLIEAHGTGTPVGDATEIEALAHVFGTRTGTQPRSAVGSVKSMIGHLMPAAGIAGLIKAALALYHKVLPPTLNVDEPNPRFGLEKTSFYINTETRPWIHGSTDAPRRAGVNAFGFGGINAHVILEEHPPSPPRARGKEGGDEVQADSHLLHWESEVLLIQGQSRADLVRQGEQLQRFLQATPDVSLKDLAYTLNVKRENVIPCPERSRRGEMCLAIVATSREDLGEKLDSALNRLADPACQRIKTRDGIYYFEEPLGREGKLAFLFPGEGAQYVNMLADLCIHFPEVRTCFDDMHRLFADHSRGYEVSDFIFPRPTFSSAMQSANDDRIWQMDVAVEALFMANHALFTLLRRLEIQPDALLGHSTGEYSAMRAAGMLDEENFAQHVLALNGLYEGHAANHTVVEATLLALGADREKAAAITEAVGDGLFVAMDNCPHQVVLLGSREVADRAAEQIRQHGLIYDVLQFDRPYHTPLFAPYAEVIRDIVASWIIRLPDVPLYSCTTAGPFPTSLVETRRIAYEHWVKPVEFCKTIEAMYADGVRIFVEVGPRGNLTTFVDDILRGRPYLAVPANVTRRSGITQLNHLLGLLAANGVPMDLAPLYARRTPQELTLDQTGHPSGKGKRRSHPITLATGWPSVTISDEAAGRLRGTRGDSRPVKDQEPATTHGGPTTKDHRPRTEDHRPATTGDRPTTNDQVMSSYLRTMEQFLAMQQEIMQAYFMRSSVSGPPSAGTEDVGSVSAVQRITPSHQPGGPPAAESASKHGDAPPVAETKLSPSSAGSPADIEKTLVRLVSDRTGYPVEMLDLDLNLEADLGIDSIKRVEILGAFQQETGIYLAEELEQLAARKTLRGMIALLTTDGATSHPVTLSSSPLAIQASNQPLIASSLPFIQEILSLTPGQALEARCEVSLERYPILGHHTLGRQVSLTDPKLAGLPVVPLTMSMEMLAEAARLLVPDKVLVGMKDVRAYRWIALDEEHMSLKIVARRETSSTGNDIHVQILNADSRIKDQAAHNIPFIEGVIVFDDAYPAPPSAGEFSLSGARPSRWLPEQMYEEVLFHGPAFRGVVSMDRWGEDGAEATLRVLPLDGLAAQDDDHTPLTDFVLLDQPGQVVAFWTAEHLDRGYVVFPFRLEALHLYGPSLPTDGSVKCQARIGLVGDWQVRSDLDVLDQSGRGWARFIGWEDRRFDLPRAFLRFMFAPRDAALSESWRRPVALLPGAETWQARRLSLDAFPDGFFTAHGGLWQRVLAHLVLSRRERDLWRSLRTPETRRVEWLLGRVAAKDAVREFVTQRYGMALCPADIEILPDAEGRPIVHGQWTHQAPDVPVLSLSHSDGLAVAVAGDSRVAEGVGVDIERLGRMNRDVEALAFTPQERDLLSSLGAVENDGWPLRFWCAKEAAAKALGQGMVGGPQALVVRAVDLDKELIQIGLAGELARRMGEAGGPTLMAFLAREGDLIVATSLYKSGRGDGRYEEKP